MKKFGGEPSVTFTHALTLARYNWPLYITAAMSIALGLTAVAARDLPFVVRLIGAFVAIVAA